MRYFLIAFAFLLTNAVGDLHATAAEFRAAAAVADITPEKLPISMTGQFYDRMATAIHDRLHARCLVLDDGQTRLAIVVCDSCLISREIFDRAKQIASSKTGIPADRMTMSATHTHTAATTMELAQCNPAPEYVELLTQRIAQAVVDANARLQPARVSWSVARAPEELNNRRWFVKPGGIAANPFGRVDDQVRTNPPGGSELLVRPAGPVDPEVTILDVKSIEGKPLSVLASYGLHYVGGIPQQQISADYFGEFARQIGRRMKADRAFVGIMANGASGDVNNSNFRKPRPSEAPFERIRAVANRIADVAFEAQQTAPPRDAVSLAMVERTLELGIRRPSEEELARARNLIENAAEPARLTTQELYAQEALRLAERPPTVTIKLQAFRIGELGGVAIPCEVFAETGLEIKRHSPFQPTFIIGLANGYNGYLPTPRQHALGGYETWRSGWSYLEVDASTKITATALDMLEELAAAGDNQDARK